MRRSNIIFSNLRAEMSRENITIQMLAEHLGVTRDTMSNKLSQKSQISLAEAFSIVNKFFPSLKVTYLFQEICEPKEKAS